MAVVLTCWQHVTSDGIAIAAGLSMIQLLPVNDTRVHGTWWDSYPYSSLSVSALHPMYLSLDAVEG